MYVILYLLFEGDYIMNDIDKIKLDVINNKLEYDELLELYIKYLIVRQSIMNKIPSYIILMIEGVTATDMLLDLICRIILIMLLNILIVMVFILNRVVLVICMILIWKVLC